MPAPQNRRLPISCEPCRARKIRCSRTRSPPGACGSCVRRGISPSRCIFLRQTTSTHQSQLQDEPITSNGGNSEELLSRIRILEELVSTRMHTSSPRSQSTLPTSVTPPTDPSQSHSNQNEWPPSVLETSPLVFPPDPPQLVGTLNISKSGHVRYEPRNSQWNSILAGSPAAVEAKTRYEDPCPSDDFPFDLNPTARIDDFLMILPPISQCDELKAVFFRVFATLFHILHDPSFDAQYMEFRKDRNSVSFSWLALLFAILSISVTAVDEDSTLLFDLGRNGSAIENSNSLSSRYRMAAMQCLAADQYLWRHNMHTLQALILLIYGINHSHGQAWALLGTTYNIALTLGCHIDPDGFGLDIVQCEERRRCWAGLSMLYSIQNISMGNLDPRSIPNDVKMPANVNDSDLTDGSLFPAIDTPTQMSYLLYKFRLYKLCSRITQEIFGSQQPSYHTIMALDEEITREQKAWAECYAWHSVGGPLPMHHIVQLHILYGYSHQLRLLLHRPVFNHGLSVTSPQEVDLSRSRCIESAKGILGIHKLLYESSEFAPFRWYNQGLGSFHAFHAAIVLFVVLVTAENVMQCYEMKQTLESSLVIFAAMAERSNVCKKATPILRLLLSTTHRANAPVPSFSVPSSEVDTDQNSQLEGLIDRLRPQHWLNPGAVPWSDWDMFLNSNDVRVG